MGSSTIDATVTRGLKDLAETVSDKNQNQMLKLDLVETDNVYKSVAVVVVAAAAAAVVVILLLLLLYVVGILKAFICMYQGESKLRSLFCRLCTSICTHHANT